MAALPYMQLYVADYLADTMHLSVDQHGAYLLLIMNYWQTGKPIPKDRLHRIVRVSDEQWQTIKPALQEFFEDDGERWIHLRIEKDLESIHTTPRGKKLPGNDSLKGYKGYVYFVTSPTTETVKIGYSKNPWARLNELRRSYGDELSVVATVKTVEKSEVSVHKVLEKYRLESEWFSKSDCISGLIEAINSDVVTTVDAMIDYVANYGSTTTPTTNTDTNTDTDTDTDKHTGSGDPESETPKEADEKAPASTPKKSSKSKHQYPEDFERLWEKYPKRPAGDSKREAFSAYNARIKEGATVEEMESGIDRYTDYLKAKDSLDTEFIKRGSTFFGPSKWYEQPFRVGRQSANGYASAPTQQSREERDAELDQMMQQQDMGVGVTYEHE